MRTIFYFIVFFTLYWFIRKVIAVFLNLSSAMRGGSSRQGSSNSVNYVENSNISDHNQFNDRKVIDAEFVELDKDGKEIK